MREGLSCRDSRSVDDQGALLPCAAARAAFRHQSISVVRHAARAAALSSNARAEGGAVRLGGCGSHQRLRAHEQFVHVLVAARRSLRNVPTQPSMRAACPRSSLKDRVLSRHMNISSIRP